LWLVLLAALPWWLGLPLLLALAAILWVPAERLGAQTGRIRAALRWGLPGVLFAGQRALGGGALAWTMALLGALAGYTLLAGLEAWLDRDRRRRPPAAPPVPEWPGLAMASIGPAAAIIELQSPQWRQAEAAFDDVRGGQVHWQAQGANGGRYRFADGTILDGAGARCCFSPDGRWFAAGGGCDTTLWDRDRGRIHRIRGWRLWGWHEGQPWLSRDDSTPPRALKDALELADPDG
jgi:hypothetical protein